MILYGITFITFISTIYYGINMIRYLHNFTIQKLLGILTSTISQWTYCGWTLNIQTENDTLPGILSNSLRQQI